MEQVKQKKSTFEKVVIVFNVIAIIFMVAIIANVGIVEECTNNSNNNIMSKMQFNQKFITYEGVITGSKVKQLIKTVNASNINNDGTDLVVSINGKTNENQYIFNGANNSRYKVEMEYDNDLVSNINIYKTNKQDETNNVITNYTEFAEITGTMQEGSIGKVNNNSSKNKSKHKIDWNLCMAAMTLYLPVLVLYLIVCMCNKFDKKRILKKYRGEECQIRLDKANTNKIIATLIITIILSIINFISFFTFNYLLITVAKPIIYIYPKEKTEVTVELGRKENLTCTYPLYEDKWEITATPDGTLTDEETGRTYYALYWEGINSKKYSNKLEEGFVVKGEDTITFLEKN